MSEARRLTSYEGVIDVFFEKAHASRPEEAGQSKMTYNDGLSAFLSVRPRLLRIAGRMLGNTAEAEDIAQDVWIRWQTVDRELVRDSVAFLVTTTTRLTINVMQSARSRRETHDRVPLREPMDESADSGAALEQTEALQLGIHRLFEKLSPTERVAFVLREAFDYSYRDIASVLGVEETNARQMVSRARQRVVNGRTRAANRGEHERFLDSFVAAARQVTTRPSAEVSAGASRSVPSSAARAFDESLRPARRPIPSR